MSDLDPYAWAEEVARALSLGGERVPFQRVLRAHRHDLDALRARGLTWHSLAQILLRAGVQRANGRPYSADHLRVCADRLAWDPPGDAAATVPSAATGQRLRARPPRRPTRPKRTDTHSPEVAHAPRASGSVATPPPPLRQSPIADDKDVSIDEIAAARARLNQIR